MTQNNYNLYHGRCEGSESNWPETCFLSLECTPHYWPTSDLLEGQSPHLLKPCQAKYPPHAPGLLPHDAPQSHGNSFTPHRAGDLMALDDQTSLWQRKQGHMPSTFILLRDQYVCILEQGPHRIEQRTAVSAMVSSCIPHSLLCFPHFPSLSLFPADTPSH